MGAKTGALGARVVLTALVLAYAGATVSAEWSRYGTAASPDSAVYVTMDLDKKDGSRPFLAYVSAGRTYARRFNTNVWPLLADPNTGGPVSEGLAEDAHLAMRPNKKGEPWVAYRDDDHDGKLSVRRWSGQYWLYVGGTPGISDGIASSISLAFAPGGGGYVAYQDVTNDGKVSVMHFKSGQWIYSGGAPGITPGGADFVRIAVSVKNTVYVAFQDLYNYPAPPSRKLLAGSEQLARVMYSPPSRKLLAGSEQLARVMYFNTGTGSWEWMGGPLSQSVASYIAITTHPVSGNPYVLFRDSANGDKLSVVKWKGGYWVPVGPLGWGGQGSSSHDIAFDGRNRLFVAYQCTVDGQAYAACVRRYTGGANGKWVPHGSQGFSKGQADYLTLRFKGVTPYVAFSDQGEGVPGKAVVYKY